MFNGSQCKLVDEAVRVDGVSTGAIKARPAFLVMLDPVAMTTELELYRIAPLFIDDCWAGQETVYLLFLTEAEARTKLSKHLS